MVRMTPGPMNTLSPITVPGGRYTMPWMRQFLPIVTWWSTWEREPIDVPAPITVSSPM